MLTARSEVARRQRAQQESVQAARANLGSLIRILGTASPSRRYGVMYRGPGPCSVMSEDLLQLCYRVAQDSGFVWVDRTTGTAWHVRTTVMFEESSGRLLTARVPETTAPLWEYTDARLRGVTQEAEVIRSAVDRELWR